jgi:pilus assembly protein CpaB
MRVARSVVLAVALVSGLAAAFVAVKMTGNRQVAVTPAPVAEIPQVETEDVLVANRDLAMGNTVKGPDLTWQPWPRNNVHESYITRTAKPNALEDLSNSIARAQIMSGEPIREARLIQSGRTSIMAAILTPGMRAMAIEVRAVSSAGGFIFPNDRVDVILTRVAPKSNGDPYQSETILHNIKVLAIDQTISESRGETAVVAKNTATLELTPRQSELLAQAAQSGTIQLALRSLRDQKVDPIAADDPLGPATPSGVTVVKYGVSSRVSTQK